MKNSQKRISFQQLRTTPKRSIIFLLIGLTGFLLFFPLNLSNNATCLYDSLNRGDQSGIASYTPVAFTFQATSGEDQLNSKDQLYLRSHLRLHSYLHDYLILWWGSVALFIWGVTMLYNKRGLLKQLMQLSHDPKMRNSI